MSWSVTARTQRPTVKVYEEERELNVLLLVDVSGSVLVGNSGRKTTMYAELAALVGLAAINAGDPFGTLLFTDSVKSYLPLRRSEEHIRVAMLKILEQPFLNARSDLRPALAYAQKVLKVRSLVLILSDFLVPGFETQLFSLARRHEVILLHGYEGLEAGRGLQGVYATQDPESGEFSVLDGNALSMRQQLANFQNELSNKLRTLGRSCGAEYLSLSVEDDYLQQVVHFFRGHTAHR
jgi:uncharacterized protein (DUF58 family)